MQRLRTALLSALVIGSIIFAHEFNQFLYHHWLSSQRIDYVHVTAKKKVPIDECTKYKRQQLDKWMTCKGYK